jgi:Reverse transcriptase (RNA-dependent DNA polymerase)/Endonuclease-reverse transcriptase
MAAHLKLAAWNANGGLNAKKTEILAFLKENAIKILLISETHLKDSSIWSIPNYKIYRTDRPLDPKSPHAAGGTAIVVHYTVKHTPLALPPLKSMEATAISVNTGQGKKLTIISAYKKPDNIIHISDLNALMMTNMPTIMAGDLNAKHRDWNSHTENSRGNKLRKHSDKNGYIVIGPPNPTHFPGNARCRPDVLDIALVARVTAQVNIENAISLTSDHNPVIITVGTMTETSAPILRRNLTKANWKQFESTVAEHIGTLPKSEPTPISIDHDLNNLYQAIQVGLDKVAPLKLITPVDRTDTLPKGILVAISIKNRARKEYQRHRTPDLKAKYNRLCKELTSDISLHRRKTWDDKIRALTFKNQSTWQMCRSLQRGPVPNTPLQGGIGLAITAEDQANLLATTLQSAFTPNPPNPETPPIEASVDDFVRSNPRPATVPDDDLATLEELAEICKNRKPRKAPGKDGITGELIEKLPKVAAQRFLQIINCSLQANYFPNIWKEAIVVCFPKPNKDSSNPDNYRPISLLSTLSKLYERVILRRLQTHIDSCHVIPNEQFGFRTNHSTTQQLMRFTNSISTAKASKRHTATVYLDVAKAFDKVWHTGLLFKLINFNFPPYLIFIVKSFLEHRSFQVRWKNTLSFAHPILAGVPQGSTLSPTLFNVFTADMPATSRHVQLYSFADDLAVAGQSTRLCRAAKYVQKALDVIHPFYQKWRMGLNASKTTATIYTTKWNECRTPELKLDGVNISWMPVNRYLGLDIDKGLTWATHIKAILKKAHFKLSKLYSLLGSPYLDLTSKLRLYKAILRPSLTYSAPVWSGCSATHIKKLQIFQNKCLRLCASAPRATKITLLHSELGIELVKDHLAKLSTNFYPKLKDSKNPLVRALATSAINKTHPSYTPPSKARVIKRPLKPRKGIG